MDSGLRKMSYWAYTLSIVYYPLLLQDYGSTISIEPTAG